MAPPQEAWLLLHALVQHSAGGSGSDVPDNAHCQSKESIERLCGQHWRLCVQTCGNADWIRSVLSCAGLASRGLAGTAVQELVQRRCGVQQERSKGASLILES